MFETLGERLAAALKKITGRGVLRPEDVDGGLREVRLALLEADVNFKVVKEFVERVRARLAGVEISPGLTAPQTVVKAVNDELVELLGGNSEGLRYASQPPTVVMLAGLQGSGKTTTAVKLALLARRDAHRPRRLALDFRRRAAAEQLKTLAERQNVAFGTGEEAIAEAARLSCDVVILDTAGRLHVDAELMEELKELKARVRVTETLLVADSMTGQEAVKVGKAFGKGVGIDGVVLTKLDGDARGGAALSLRVATGQQIRFAGTGAGEEAKGGDHPPDDPERAGHPPAHRRRPQAPDRPRQWRAARRYQPAAQSTGGDAEAGKAIQPRSQRQARRTSPDVWTRRRRLVKIRLRRMGAKKHPFYRLVVADARSPRDGRFIEHLGYYDPMTEPVQVKIDVDKVKKWLQQGAQPSEAARSLLKREGILERRAEKSTPTA